MIRLIAIEARRFVSRTAVRAACVALLLLTVLAGVLTFAVSNRDVAAATAHSRADAMNEYRQCLSGELVDEGASRSFVPERDCVAPDLSQVTADPRFHIDALPDVLAGTSAFLVLIGLGLGASAIGAEWHHRTMGTTLTWEGRRVRLATAKLAATAVVIAAGIVALLAILSVALVPAAVYRGAADGVTVAWLGEVAGVAARGATLAGMASIIGGSIALIVRNSALALGITFGWLFVAENTVRGLRPGWRRWLVGENSTALVVPGADDVLRSSLGGGIVLACYVVALALLAVNVFRSRDIA